jgi:hypothetical protein
MRRVVLAIGCACLLSTLTNGQTVTKPQQKPTLETAAPQTTGPNAEVVDLVQKGVKEETILGFVKNYNGKFNTSAKDLLISAEYR